MKGPQEEAGQRTRGRSDRQGLVDREASCGCSIASERVADEDVSEKGETALESKATGKKPRISDD